MNMENHEDDNYGDEKVSNLKPGTFRARAMNAGLGEAGTGNLQVAVMFQILDEGFEGETIPWYGSFSKNKGKGAKTPLQRTIESLRACGWEGDDLSDLSTVRGEVSLVLDNEKNLEGETVLKVKWVNSVGGGLALKKPLNDDQAKAFAAKMRGEVIAASRTIPKQNGNVKKPSGDPRDDLDFPPREDEGY